MRAISSQSMVATISTVISILTVYFHNTVQLRLSGIVSDFNFVWVEFWIININDLIFSLDGKWLIHRTNSGTHLLYSQIEISFVPKPSIWVLQAWTPLRAVILSERNDSLHSWWNLHCCNVRGQTHIPGKLGILVGCLFSISLGMEEWKMFGGTYLAPSTDYLTSPFNWLLLRFVFSGQIAHYIDPG